MQPSRFVRRPRSAAFAAGLIVAGAAIAAAGGRLFADPPAPPTVVRDAALSFRFAGNVPLGKVAGGGVSLGPADGSGSPTPTGIFVTGRPLTDPATGRSVVLRPEAIREYFALVEDREPDDAALQTERTLARLEKTGDLRPLARIDAGLRAAFGPTAGTRLDDPGVYAQFPAQLEAPSPLQELRTLIAGDDVLWRNYLVQGDINAFSVLAQNAGYERFHHSVDVSTGVANEDSDLRRREHRRVIVRRVKNFVTFLPNIPMHVDLSDAGLAAGTDFQAAAARSLRSSAKSVTLPGGATMKFVRGLAAFRTAPDTGDGGTFGGDATPLSTGLPEPPRVVNMSPPAGEVFIDPTTDWEDPDNMFTVPIPQRRLFVLRVRFSKPLDPRTVTPSQITLTKVATVDGLGSVHPLANPQAVSVGVFLSQRRMGEVRVDVQPFVNLDPQSLYELRVAGTIKSLDGTPLGTDFVAQPRTN